MIMINISGSNLRRKFFYATKIIRQNACYKFLIFLFSLKYHKVYKKKLGFEKFLSIFCKERKELT